MARNRTLKHEDDEGIIQVRIRLPSDLKRWLAHTAIDEGMSQQAKLLSILNEYRSAHTHVGGKSASARRA